MTASSSTSPAFENVTPRRRLFQRDPEQAFIDDIASMFHVGDENQDFTHALMIAIAQQVRFQRCDIAFDRRVELVENIVETPRFGDLPPVPLGEGLPQPEQHRLKNVRQT